MAGIGTKGLVDALNNPVYINGARRCQGGIGAESMKILQIPPDWKMCSVARIPIRGSLPP